MPMANWSFPGSASRSSIATAAWSSVIKVKEGQRVKKGDLLVELAAAEVRAQERALAAQMINFQAQRARLEAELNGSSIISWPAEFSQATGAKRAEVDEAIRVQSNEFRARRSLLVAQSSVLGQQSAQANESATGYRSQMVSSAEQERLIQEEIDSLKEVAAKGFVSQTRIRALERAKADLQGKRGQYQASVAEARASAGGGRLRQIEAQKTYRERASSELREVEFALGELIPKYRAASDQLERCASGRRRRGP